MPLKLHASLRYQSDLNVPMGSIKPSPISLRRKLFPEACRAELTQEMMQRADVDPVLQPTELTIPHIRALSDAYAHLCAHEPRLSSYEFREELSLKHQRKNEHKPVDSFMDSTWSAPQPCWGILSVDFQRWAVAEKKSKTKRSPLIVCVSRWRQHIALSSDISTWHRHAFLNTLPAPREK